MNELDDILEACNHGTCIDEEDLRIIKEAASKMAYNIGVLESKNKEALDTLDDCCHHHGREVRKLKDRIEFLEKEKLVMDGGKQYIMSIVMKEQRRQDKEFLESIPSGYRTPFQQAYLDHISKEGQ